MFVINLPPKKVWVRNEYLYDLRRGHGEYTLGYWVSLSQSPVERFTLRRTCRTTAPSTINCPFLRS